MAYKERLNKYRLNNGNIEKQFESECYEDGRYRTELYWTSIAKDTPENRAKYGL